jgi:ACR3 family arsenite efflux pump ArsB
MELIIVIAVYYLVFHLLFITRKSMKTSNPHYSLFDDILLWTGIPFAFGYFLYVVINPENQSKFVYQVIDETSHLMIPLYSWMLISGLLFAWRNRKSRRLY